MHVPEIFYGVGALILLAAILWGTLQYRSRNRANDPITERATHDLYNHPESYSKRKEERDLKPS